LAQKAGVPPGLLPRLGLDAGAEVMVGSTSDETGYYVDDDGPGLDGTPEEIARLFSIARPLVSSKLLRLPTRGALGNGLRVVAGAVLASEGSLFVTTRNRRIELRPERDGSTTVASVRPVNHPVGTLVAISFGPALLRDDDDDALAWANSAVGMAQGEVYGGKTSPWWYDVPHFHELLDATGERPVRELVAELDGCSGNRAGEIVAEAGLNRAVCNSLTRDQAESLLLAARANAKPVSPKRLGAIGDRLRGYAAYVRTYGTAGFGAAEPLARVPFVVEAWVTPTEDGCDTFLSASVNRTPVTGEIYATRAKRDIDVFGCGLHHTVAKAPADEDFSIHLNVTTPFMPITSDGKEPDLQPFLSKIMDAIGKAVLVLHLGTPRTSQRRV
jgi:hypothetical protein